MTSCQKKKRPHSQKFQNIVEVVNAVHLPPPAENGVSWSLLIPPAEYGITNSTWTLQTSFHIQKEQPLTAEIASHTPPAPSKPHSTRKKPYSTCNKRPPPAEKGITNSTWTLFSSSHLQIRISNSRKLQH